MSIPPKLQPLPQADLAQQLSDLATNLANDPTVDRFSVKVNKGNGIATVTATNISGQTITRQMVGPGLSVTTAHAPSDRNARDQNIHALRALGMTQTDIGNRLGVSQSTVQKVLAPTKT